MTSQRPCLLATVLRSPRLGARHPFPEPGAWGPMQKRGALSAAHWWGRGEPGPQMCGFPCWLLPEHIPLLKAKNEPALFWGKRSLPRLGCACDPPPPHTGPPGKVFSELPSAEEW